MAGHVVLGFAINMFIAYSRTFDIFHTLYFHYRGC